jgi:phage-related protein
LLGPLAGAFAGIAAISVVGNKIDEFDALAKSARTAGAAADESAFKSFQVLKQAMNEAGIEAATFDRAMLQTTSRLQEGIEGNKSFVEITEKLGGAIRDTNGDLKAGPELLKSMINALNEGTITTDEFAKVVGGRAGPLIQQQFASLNTSAEQLEATLSDVAENSNIVSLDAAENAEVFNDNIGRLKEGMSQLLTDAITPLLPHLVRLSEEILAHMPEIIAKVQAGFAALQPVFELVGTVLTELVFPILQKVFEVLGKVAEAITPLIEFLLPGIKSAFEAIVSIVESVVAAFERVIETLGQIGGKVRELSSAVGGKFKEMKDGAVGAAKDTYNGVTGWFGGMYDDIVGNSIVPDMVKGVLGEMDDMEGGMLGSAKRAIQGVLSTMSSLTGGFDIGSAFTGAFDGFKDLFKGGIDMPQIQSQLPVQTRPQIEAIIPGFQTQPNNVNLAINAVDALSFKQLVARDPEFISAIAMSGMRNLSRSF